MVRARETLSETLKEGCKKRVDSFAVSLELKHSTKHSISNH